MSWHDFVAVAPAVIGIVMGVLAIIETFVEPETLRWKLAWSGVFVLLGAVAIWLTVQQQRIVTADQKHDQRNAEQDRKRLEKKMMTLKPQRTNWEPR